MSSEWQEFRVSTKDGKPDQKQLSHSRLNINGTAAASPLFTADQRSVRMTEKLSSHIGCLLMPTSFLGS